MIAYQTNEHGIYVGEVTCQPSPLEPGVFLIPSGAVDVKPPKLADDEFAIWENGEWIIEKVLPAEEPVVEAVPELTYMEKYALVQNVRRSQYQMIADPLFFGWQAGENTKEDWIAAREMIKTTNPYPIEETI